MKTKKSKINGFLPARLDLKLILNLWTAITICLFMLDFFSGNIYDSAAASVGVIYLAMLGIYVGEKEYIRWKTKFASKFTGEVFVIIWTIVMAIFAIGAPLSLGAWKIPAEFAVVYTSVVGVFAISQHSKNLKKHGS